ncbi:hypothetical protein RclHR1_29930002 [Rhizophagus clarus]|uniref:Uncharacterized protein n=1 Tax=Rhizophagus clarus TaxID=94130 RepID=A0A2Z6RZ75_9GLOM|nr:hypothetical protein RclHR1_29930002 [Rhizophagus clarus]
MTAILQHSLSSKQPIHFMPTEVSDKFGIETISAYPLQGYHAEKKPYIRVRTFMKDRILVLIWDIETYSSLGLGNFPTAQSLKKISK